MDLVSFARALRELTIDEIRAIAADLDDSIASAAEEIAATRAVLGIESALRRARHIPQAALAAHSVAQAVQSAAKAARVRLPDDDVTRVARSASQLVRGLIAGPDAAPETRCLARGWQRVAAAHALVAA